MACSLVITQLFQLLLGALVGGMGRQADHKLNEGIIVKCLVHIHIRFGGKKI
jgi:hypothetical protein